PSEYITKGSDSRGVANIVIEDDEEIWQFTLVDDSRALLVTREGIESEVRFDFDSERAKFSPNGRYIAMYDMRTSELARIDLYDEEFEVVRPFQDSTHDGYIHATCRITNSGSIVLVHGRTCRIYDSDLNLVVFNYSSQISSMCYADDGSRVFITYGDSVIAYDSSGEMIWSRELDLYPNRGYVSFLYCSPDGRVLVVVVDYSLELHVLDGDTGDIIHTRTTEGYIREWLTFSPNSSLYSYPEMLDREEDSGGVISLVLDAGPHDSEDLRRSEYVEYLRGLRRHFEPIAVSNSGLQLYRVNTDDRVFRYVLFSPDFQPLYRSEEISWETWADEFTFSGAISSNSEEFCYFDGQVIQVFSIEGIR
ncbi:MAG: WD40 repeat domain-containing protein, partial [Candidatus Aegiribacteria sp.]